MAEVVFQGTLNRWSRLGLVGCLMAGAVQVSSSAWAVPTQQEAYRNDQLGVVVYKDSENPEVFWYLPILKPFYQDGSIVHRKRVRSDGNTDFTFYVVPQFPNDLAEFVANEIPGLHNRQQLKPVRAKRFALQVRQFNLAALSDEVTDYRYINNPQMVRLSLNPDDAADFEDLFSASPGVPVNMAIYYESERVEKYLQIELSYREVYDALQIGASGRYTFTKAEIKAQMADYLSNKYLTIRSKGGLQMPEIVERVIQECFTPATRPTAPTAPAGRRTPLLELLSPVAASEYRHLAALEELLTEHAPGFSRLLPNGDNEDGEDGDAGGLPPLPPLRRGPVSLPAGTGAGTGTGTRPPGRTGAALPGEGEPASTENSLEFTFKRDLVNRDEKFLFMQQEMIDAQEIAVIPAYLSSVTSENATRSVTPLASKTLVVGHQFISEHPKGAGVLVHPGDQWTINASFTLRARSYYGDGTLKTYRWDPWPRVDGDLYYRVGSGPWVKVNGRAMVGADTFQSGELQFYIDREAIWGKIPADYKEASMLGMVPAVFEYTSTFPQFNVTLSGRHVQSFIRGQ